MKAPFWFIRYRESIIPALLTVVAVLFLANLVRHGVLTASRLAKNKDALSALQSCVQVVILVLGAVFSYYRFFRGRTFVARGDLVVTVITVNGERVSLHGVTLEFKNLGTTTVWRPKAALIVRSHAEPNGWTLRDSPAFAQEDVMVIDSGETASFTTTLEIPKDISALELDASVKDADGTLWRRVVLVPNVAKSAA